jgi:hypothetical protein
METLVHHRFGMNLNISKTSSKRIRLRREIESCKSRLGQDSNVRQEYGSRYRVPPVDLFKTRIILMSPKLGRPSMHSYKVPSSREALDESLFRWGSFPPPLLFQSHAHYIPYTRSSMHNDYRLTLKCILPCCVYPDCQLFLVVY